MTAHTGRSVADLGIATTHRLTAGVVLAVGDVFVTARFGDDDFTWQPEGDIPAIGSTVWMEVRS